MNQHVRATKAPASAPSDLDPPSLQWERLGDIASELPPLFKRHWEELATHKDRVPLEPDWDKYFHLDFDGFLRIITVRDNGLLVGYLFLILGPGLHYASTLHAHVDMYWIDPLYRAGFFGIKLFKEAERYCKEMGVQRVAVSEKVHFLRERGGIGVIFKRLGYAPQDILWAKYIGD